MSIFNPNIGKRTGVDIKAGKAIKILDNGFEDFEDYWTDKSDGEDESFLKVLAEKENEASSSSKGPTLDRPPKIRSMSPFAVSTHGDSGDFMSQIRQLENDLNVDIEDQSNPDIDIQVTGGQSNPDVDIQTTGDHLQTTIQPDIQLNAPPEDLLDSDLQEIQPDIQPNTEPNVEPDTQPNTQRSTEVEGESDSLADAPEKQRSNQAEGESVPSADTQHENEVAKQTGLANQNEENAKQVGKRTKNDKGVKSSEVGGSKEDLLTEDSLEQDSDKGINPLGEINGTITAGDEEMDFDKAKISSAVNNFKTRKRLTYSGFTTPEDSPLNSKKTSDGGFKKPLPPGPGSQPRLQSETETPDHGNQPSLSKTPNKGHAGSKQSDEDLWQDFGQSETQSKVEADSQSETETQSEVEVDIQTETQSETEADRQSETGAQSEVKTDTQTETETQSETQSEVEAGSQSEAVTGSQSETEIESEGQVGSQSDAASQSESVKEMCSKAPGTDTQTESESEVEKGIISKNSKNETTTFETDPKDTSSDNDNNGKNKKTNIETKSKTSTKRKSVFPVLTDPGVVPESCSEGEADESDGFIMLSKKPVARNPKRQSTIANELKNLQRDTKLNKKNARKTDMKPVKSKLVVKLHRLSTDHVNVNEKLSENEGEISPEIDDISRKRLRVRKNISEHITGKDSEQNVADTQTRISTTEGIAADVEQQPRQKANQRKGRKTIKQSKISDELVASDDKDLQGKTAAETQNKSDIQASDNTTSKDSAALNMNKDLLAIPTDGNDAREGVRLSDIQEVTEREITQEIMEYNNNNNYSENNKASNKGIKNIRESEKNSQSNSGKNKSSKNNDKKLNSGKISTDVENPEESVKTKNAKNKEKNLGSKDKGSKMVTVVEEKASDKEVADQYSDIAGAWRMEGASQKTDRNLRGTNIFENLQADASMEPMAVRNEETENVMPASDHETQPASNLTGNVGCSSDSESEFEVFLERRVSLTDIRKNRIVGKKVVSESDGHVTEDNDAQSEMGNNVENMKGKQNSRKVNNNKRKKAVPLVSSVSSGQDDRQTNVEDAHKLPLKTGATKRANKKKFTRKMFEMSKKAVSSQSDDAPGSCDENGQNERSLRVIGSLSLLKKPKGGKRKKKGVKKKAKKTVVGENEDHNMEKETQSKDDQIANKSQIESQDVEQQQTESGIDRGNKDSDKMEENKHRGTVKNKQSQPAKSKQNKKDKQTTRNNEKQNTGNEIDEMTSHPEVEKKNLRNRKKRSDYESGKSSNSQSESEKAVSLQSKIQIASKKGKSSSGQSDNEVIKKVSGRKTKSSRDECEKVVNKDKLKSKNSKSAISRGKTSGSQSESERDTKASNPSKSTEINSDELQKCTKPRCSRRLSLAPQQLPWVRRSTRQSMQVESIIAQFTNNHSKTTDENGVESVKPSELNTGKSSKSKTSQEEGMNSDVELHGFGLDQPSSPKASPVKNSQNSKKSQAVTSGRPNSHTAVTSSQAPAEAVTSSRPPAEAVTSRRVPAESVPSRRVLAEAVPSSRAPAEAVPSSRAPIDAVPSVNPHKEVTQDLTETGDYMPTPKTVTKRRRKRRLLSGSEGSSCLESTFNTTHSPMTPQLPPTDNPLTPQLPPTSPSTSKEQLSPNKKTTDRESKTSSQEGLSTVRRLSPRRRCLDMPEVSAPESQDEGIVDADDEMGSPPAPKKSKKLTPRRLKCRPASRSSGASGENTSSPLGPKRQRYPRAAATPVRVTPVPHPAAKPPKSILKKPKHPQNQRKHLDGSYTPNTMPQVAENSVYGDVSASMLASGLLQTPGIDPITPYNKKTVKIILPSPPLCDGVRRSQRVRVAPLEWYKGERIVYSRRNSSGHLCFKGLTEPSRMEEERQEERKKRTGRGEPFKQARKRVRPHNSSPPKNLEDKNPSHSTGGRNLAAYTDPPTDIEMLESSEVPVINPQTSEEVLVECVKVFDHYSFVSPGGSTARPSDPLALCKVMKQAAFSLGILIIRPGEEKERQLVRKDTMVFIVKYGRVAVTIHRTMTILQTDDTFFVPQGNTYSIKNLCDDEATLWYFQHKGDRGDVNS